MKAYHKDSRKRFWEVDFLRGTAIVMMIVFHFLYDLNYFGGLGVNVSSGFWRYFAYATAGIFIFLVGVSLTLSYSRAEKEKAEKTGKTGKTEKSEKTERTFFMKSLVRGIKIFSWGLIITLITFIFQREGLIVFGILHFIGISVILAYPFIRHVYRTLALGILFILLGLYLMQFNFDFYWLTWLGFKPEFFYTFDYFPLLPWFGVVLAGISLGNVLYRGYERRFNIPKIPDFIFIRLLCFLGKHSLLIYLIHQPVLIALLYFFGVKINL